MRAALAEESTPAWPSMETAPLQPEKRRSGEFPPLHNRGQDPSDGQDLRDLWEGVPDAPLDPLLEGQHRDRAGLTSPHQP